MWRAGQNMRLSGRPLMSFDELMTIKDTDAVIMTEATPPILARKLQILK